MFWNKKKELPEIEVLMQINANVLWNCFFLIKLICLNYIELNF